ncbi:MAG: YIP1 family protein [Anaerolineae bacterium]|nr:YIP1 family protein [Anaerolineae bacterium]
MAEARRSTLALLPGIIDQPQRTLAQVALYPRGRWLPPLIFLIIALSILAVLRAPFAAQEATKEFQAQLATLPADQAQMVQGQLQFIGSPPFIAGTAIVLGMLSLLVGWIIAAAILYFASLLAGGELGYGRALALAPWLWLPYGLRDLVQALYVFMEGKVVVYQGLSFLVATGDNLKDMRDLAYLLLSQADLFALWHYLLVYAGLRAAGQLSQGSALFMTLVYAALTLALGAVPGLIGGSLMPGGG